MSSCATYKKVPTQAFEVSQLSKKPDYADSQNWSALPHHKDDADLTPKGQPQSQEDDAQADVFFVHPTTYVGGKTWNAKVPMEKIDKSTDHRAVKNQATVFNQSCRVYAPRYRQMVLGGFFHPEDSTNRDRALAVAWSDVKSAFEYYLKHHNQGRPIIIAGHSQGALHATRLVKEFFDGKTLKNKLVVAYLIGWPFKKEVFEDIPICQSPEQTGCAVGWASWKMGVVPKTLNTFYKDAVVVNPLTWTTDTEWVAPDQHKGLLMGNFKTMWTEKLSTQIHDGILWVSSPSPFFFRKNYHIADYNFFWLDIRANVKTRIGAFWK